MITDNYWEFVARMFAKKHTGPDGLMHAAAGAAGEAGEILDENKKHWVYGKKLDVEKVIEEIGDELFYLTALCNLLGFRLADAFSHNMAKLNRRYPQGYTDAAAIARVDKNGRVERSPLPLGAE